jgi:pyruvate,water dikinase
VPLSEYGRLVEYYLDRIGADPTLANYPEVVLYNQYPSPEFLVSVFGRRAASRYRCAYDRFFRRFRRIENTLALSCRRQFVPRWRAKMRRRSRIDSLDLRALCLRYREVADLLRTEACVVFVKAARVGFFAFTRLRNLLTELFGEKGAE